MNKTQLPQERIKNERLDSRAKKLRAKQQAHKPELKQAPPDTRGQLLHDGSREKHDAPYREYLLSKHWRIVKAKALELADNQCSACGDRRHLCVHHVTYANLWHEYANDVTVLCDTCHNMLHGQFIYPVA